MDIEVFFKLNTNVLVAIWEILGGHNFDNYGSWIIMGFSFPLKTFVSPTSLVVVLWTIREGFSLA